MVRGDQYYMAVCNKTGAIAIYNPSLNLFLSPFADGPLVFNKTIDGKLILDIFSIYGRSFSVLKIPYALKLLIQELQVMNVQMRIITEDNVDQLLNLSYQSKNIEKLLHLEQEIEDDGGNFLINYKTRVTKKINKVDDEINKIKNKKTEETKEEEEIEEKELEKELEQDYSPPMAVGSPAYIPSEQELNNYNNDNDNENKYSFLNDNYNNSSPPTAQGSPAYMPTEEELNANANEYDFDNVNYIKVNENQTQTQVDSNKSNEPTSILNVEEPIPINNEDQDQEQTRTESDSSKNNESKKIIII
jgi:DNA-directed RNA polymerase II subunit RPB2